MRVVRLGEGVDRTGELSAAALERTFGVLREYAGTCRELGAERVRMVATSATRDARNRDEFTGGVRDILGVDPEVVTGDQEAALSFIGATGDLAARADLAAPYLVVDIGGGSTEFVLGGRKGPVASRSVDIGCVRMTERHLVSDPPTDGEIGAAIRDIDAALDVAESVVPLEGVATLVGLAGSVTTITAHLLRLPAYDPERVHLAHSAPADMVVACDELLGMPRAQRAALPYMHPGRVDVIGAGALVWRRIVERVVDRAGVTQVVTSEHDILDGIALSAARRG
jgi:exopolyphosphatase/guanosine-5'-triphosphate,3'-diphosphate pyrophosphatase